MNSKDELTTLEQALQGDPSEDDPTEGLKKPQPPGPERSGLFAGVAVFLALGALAVSGLLWLEAHDGADEWDPGLQDSLRQLQQGQSAHSESLSELSQRLDRVSANSGQDDLRTLESRLAEQGGLVTGLQDALETQQAYASSLQQAIDSLQARLRIAESGLATRSPSVSNAPQKLDLATVEYLLRLAPERLALFHDVQAADQALVQADAQLAAMDNPVYIGLRQHIAEARQTLESTKLPNPVEISARLDHAQGRLAGLTFGGESNAGRQSASGEDPAQAGGESWWQRLKSSLAGLVTVRRSATDAGERLTIEDKDLLRQGLWMQIEGARLALMRNDQASWVDTLTRANEALEKWFDRSSTEYEALHDELEALVELSIKPDLPDISGPWAQLQLIRQAQGIPARPAPLSGDSAMDRAGSETPQGQSDPDHSDADADADAGQPEDSNGDSGEAENS